MHSRGDILSLTLTAILFMVILGVYIGARVVVDNEVKAFILSSTILDRLLKIYSSSRFLTSLNRYSFIFTDSINSTYSDFTVPMLTFSNGDLHIVFIGLGD
jgi:hypothetical protein